MTEPAAITAAPPVLVHLGPVEVTRRRLMLAVLTAALLGGLTYFWHTLGPEELLARTRALPAAGVLAVISLAPLLGFPVSVLHLLAGLRFDFLTGLLVVTLTGMCHHLLGWAFVRFLPRRYFTSLDPWREKLVGAGHRDATLLCCVLPGMPYTVQLYLLPAIGTPLWLLIWVAAPLHTVRAVVTLLLGSFSDDLTPARLALLVGYYVTLIVVSGLTLRQLRRTISRNQPASATTNPLHP